jgi:hypothetical protein
MIQSLHMKKCVSRSKTFLLFKGPQSFKKNFNRRKCRGIKGLSIDTTHNPPPPPTILQYLLRKTKSVTVRIPTGWSMSSAALICCKHIARKVTTARRLAPWKHKKISSLFQILDEFGAAALRWILQRLHHKTVFA